MSWTEAAFSACLLWHWPDHHWQCNWRVAWTSSRMGAGKRRTLRASVVTIFSRNDKRRFSFSQVWHPFWDCFFWKLPQIRTSNFRKVVRQHIKGTARNIIRLLLEIYFSFQRLKNFENPLRIDTIIAMSLVYYFFGTQCVKMYHFFVDLS